MSTGRRRLPRPASRRGTRDARARSALRSPREELAEATTHGQLYLRRLRRAQLNLSTMALIAFGAIFGVLPLALLLLPALMDTMLLGIPLGLWILVVPMLPLFLVIGWIYARRADALDDAFRDVVE